MSGRAVSIHTVTEAFGLPEQRVVTTARDVEINAVLTTRIGNRETNVLQYPASATTNGDRHRVRSNAHHQLHLLRSC